MSLLTEWFAWWMKIQSRTRLPCRNPGLATFGVHAILSLFTLICIPSYLIYEIRRSLSYNNWLRGVLSAHEQVLPPTHPVCVSPKTETCSSLVVVQIKQTLICVHAICTIVGWLHAGYTICIKTIRHTSNN